MNPAPTWKKVIAFFIDLLGTFIIFGYVIALITGNTTDEGFQLNGLPAFVLFASIIGYFIAMNKFAGGTLGKKLLGIGTKQQ